MNIYTDTYEYTFTHTFVYRRMGNIYVVCVCLCLAHSHTRSAFHTRTHLEHHASVPALECGIMPVSFATQRAALGFSTCFVSSGQRCCRLELLAGFLQRQRAGLVRLVFLAQDHQAVLVRLTFLAGRSMRLLRLLQLLAPYLPRAVEGLGLRVQGLGCGRQPTPRDFAFSDSRRARALSLSQLDRYIYIYSTPDYRG